MTLIIYIHIQLFIHTDWYTKNQTMTQYNKPDRHNVTIEYLPNESKIEIIHFTSFNPVTKTEYREEFTLDALNNTHKLLNLYLNMFYKMTKKDGPYVEFYDPH